jgi:hypothetical protein
MPGFPKSRPPANRVALERWINQKAQDDGVAANRLRRAVSFMVLSAVLARFVDEQGAPLFLLKGGVAMELRVGVRARASKDYDTAFRDELTRLGRVIGEASVHAHGDFRLTAGAIEPIGPTGAVRIPIRIAYAHYDWSLVDLEVSAAEGQSRDATMIEYASPAPALSVFGLPDGERVALFPLSYQIAQKLHACTEVRSDRDNDRFRDLVDLILLEEIIAAGDLAAVRSACEEVFALRARQSWPPSIRIYPLWPEQYRALATGMGFPITEVGGAAEAVKAFIERIASAGAPH